MRFSINGERVLCNLYVYTEGLIIVWFFVLPIVYFVSVAVLLFIFRLIQGDSPSMIILYL